MGRSVASEAPLQLADEEEVDVAVQAARADNRSALTRSAGAAFGRGILLALLAAAIGVLLLAYALDGDGPKQVATGGTATSQPAATGETTGDTQTSAPPASETTATTVPTPTTHAPASVSIQVLNANGAAGIAGANAQQLISKGFVAVAGDAPARVDQTVVYVVDQAFQPDALVVAQALSIAADKVLPLPDPATSGIDAKGSPIVVILGGDNQFFKPG